MMLKDELEHHHEIDMKWTFLEKEIPKFLNSI